MTFEEFFIKKKIDLVQLKSAEPGLFSEFKSHFELMGEKSFDQVKKFWFNKLRRSYHLKEEAKPAKETIVKEKIASQAEPLYSPTLDQKPEDFPGSQPVAPDTAEAEDQTEATPKPAIKPKFTPRNIPAKHRGTVIGELPQTEVSKEDASKSAEDFLEEKAAVSPPTAAEPSAPQPEQKEPAKPAFKPRFNMKNIKQKEEEAGEEETKTESSEIPAASSSSTEAKEEGAKPTFKPRFNMKNIKPKEESGISIPASAPESSALQEAPQENKQASAAPELKEEGAKPAFKPRFNMKNIKPKEESGISIPASAPEGIASGQEISPNVQEDIKPKSQEEDNKPAYKPRFNMKNVKPKEESGISIPASAPENTTSEESTEVAESAPDVEKEISKSEKPNSEDANPNPAYKPRFNLKNIKPKSSEE